LSTSVLHFSASIFDAVQVATERGHSCPPRCCRVPSGQECPRSVATGFLVGPEQSRFLDTVVCGGSPPQGRCERRRYIGVGTGSPRSGRIRVPEGDEAVPVPLPELSLRALGGDFCNLDSAGTVSIMRAVIVGWREGGRVDRIGARAGGRRQGCRARIPGCWGCRDGGQEGTKGGTKKLETSKEHPRNMLPTCLQPWG
jgi:hypothetical protein